MVNPPGRGTGGVPAIVAAASLLSWRGQVWRCHDGRFPADSWEGSRYYSGRFHRAPDLYPAERTWAALYTALAPEIALGEAIRYQAPHIRRIADYHLSEVAVSLSTVVDLRNIATHGVDLDALLDDWDRSLGQEIGEITLNRGAEGVLIPSASRLGDNLIVLPDNMAPASRVQATSYRSLYHVLRY